jgi:replicative DNA helicase
MGATQGGLSPIEGAVSRALERIEQASASGHHMTGVRTGIPRLDQLTGGWQKKDLIILAARPSMGKTACALDFARAAAYAGTTVAFFSLEMSSESLAQRTMSQVSGINLRRLRTGELNDAEWDTLSQSVGKVALLPIHIDDQGGTDMAHLRTQCRRLKATSKLGLVIIDYLQLINSSRHQSIEQEVAELSRGLKGMARELDVPVIVLSQLSRDCEKRPDRRPMLSDLRYSGAIEQDADIVMFLYRPQVYGISTVEVFGRQRSSEGVAELLLSKQRNGPTATVALHWSAQATTFSELAEDMETTYV